MGINTSNETICDFKMCYLVDKNKHTNMKKAQIRFGKFILILFSVLISSQVLFAQSGSVKGTIKDDNGNPMPGATISIEGTTLGSTSDISGFYSLDDIPIGNQILKISFIGFETIIKPITIAAGKTIELTFTLKEDAYSLQTVLVTAAKRSEKIQDVPQSISAISGRKIKELGITDANAYLTTLPGLQTVALNPTTTSVIIRGIQPLGGWASSVGYYIGETPVTEKDLNPSLSSFDVERIEVLRGPQGTLYGEGSMGGTIKVIPNKANANQYQYKFDPELSITGGGLNYQLNGMVNIPVIENKLAVRATGYYRNDAGYINNVGLGIDNANTFDAKGGRFSVRYYANKKLTLSASAIFNKSETGGNFASNTDYEQTTTVKESGDDKYSIYNLNAYYNFSFANLTVTGSYFTRENNIISDLNALIPTVNYVLGLGGIEPVTSLWIDAPYNVDSYTAEARLVSSNPGPFKWTTGLFYKNFDRIDHFVADSDPHIDDQTASDLMESIFGIPGVTGLMYSNSKIKLEQIAVFGELSYAITPKLDILGGVRLFNEKRNFSTYSDGIFPVLISGLPPEEYTDKGDESVVNPKFTLTYKPGKNILTYANASRGFRSGGQNVYYFLYPGASSSYNSESLWNYELGFKTSFMNEKLIFNAAYFYNDWTDMQIVTRNISDLKLTENVGKAHTTGVDLEITWVPVNGLMFSMNGNYTQAETDVAVQVPAGIDPETGDELFTEVPEGTQLPSIPKTSLNLAGQYKFSISKSTYLTTRVDYNYTGEKKSHYPDLLNGIDLPSNSTINLRATLEYKWLNAYVFINNLTNERVINEMYYQDPSLGNIYYMGRPQTIGIGFRTSF